MNVADVRERVDALAGRDRDRGRGAHARERVAGFPAAPAPRSIPGRNGSSIAATPHGRRRREAPVHLDHDLRRPARPPRAPPRRSPARRRSGAGELRAGGAERIELQRAIAARDDRRAASSAIALGSRSA